MDAQTRVRSLGCDAAKKSLVCEHEQSSKYCKLSYGWSYNWSYKSFNSVGVCWMEWVVKLK